MVRCTVCGHNAPYREGVRYCAACAAPLPLHACPGCRRDNFHGDRFCAFCAKPLPGAPAMHALPGAEPTAGASAGEASKLLALAAEARTRAEAVKDAPPATTKRHLGQDDIDALFGGPGS